MSIVIEKSALTPMIAQIAALAKPGPFEASKYAFVSCVDNSLHVRATDGHNWLRLHASTDGVLGDIQVDAAKLSEVIRSMRGDTIKLDTKDGKLILSSKEGGKRTLAGTIMPFPEAPEPEGERVSVSGARLKQAVAFVRQSMSDDTHNRAHLCGIHLHSSRGCYKAAAAYRAGMASVEMGAGDAEFAVTVGGVTVGHLSLLPDDDVTLVLGERSLAFQWSQGSLQGQQVALAFPAYEKAIPTHATTLAIRAGELKECINAMLPVSAVDSISRSQILKLLLSPEGVSLESRNAKGDDGACPVDGEWPHNATYVGFIAKSMKAALEPFGDDELRVEIGNPQQPVVLRSTSRKDRISMLSPSNV